MEGRGNGEGGDCEVEKWYCWSEQDYNVSVEVVERIQGQKKFDGMMRVNKAVPASTNLATRADTYIPRFKDVNVDRLNKCYCTGTVCWQRL